MGELGKENQSTQQQGETNNGRMQIRVIDQRGQEIQFKVRESTPFEKVMKAYAERLNVDMGRVKWIFDGDRVQKTDTPRDLNMTDGSQVEVLIEQTGGSQQAGCCM